MEIQQMFEQLLAGQARLLKRMDAYHEERMAMFGAYEKSIIACLREMDANTEKINPGMMQSVEEHQDVPNDDGAVM
jgi:molybdopterin-biosynthesis enzyme MoeA-like protein